MSAPATLACPRCATPLVSLAPGASVGRVSLQCTRCGHWLQLGQDAGGPVGAGAPAAGWPAPPSPPTPPARPGWSPLPPGLATSFGEGPDPRRMGPLEWLGAAAGLLGGLVFLLLGLAMGRFRTMLGSLGGELPGLTTFALTARLPYLLAAAVLGLTLAGVALRLKGLGLGRWLLLAAIAVALVGAPLCIVSLYLPIFSLADAIK